MKLRRPPLIWTAFAPIAVAMVMLTPTGANAKKPPPGGGGGGGSTTSTYVKDYANVLNGTEYELTPDDVQATPDGGWISLAVTRATSGVGVSWLLKTSAVGAPEWQQEIGCLNTAPGDYSDEVSLQPTSDGGYVLAGGTIGCGSGSDCPNTSGIQCGLIEKIDGTGRVSWAEAYTAGADGTAIEQITRTGDGGFVAVGSATDLNHNTGALILKLDSRGTVRWQRELGPTGTRQAYLNAVQQTSDGGFVAAGELNDGSSSGSGGLPLLSVLAVRFDAAGNVIWQRGFNDLGFAGVAATEHAQSVVQTSDGGYAIGGGWSSTTSPGTCCQGALLLKLTPTGAIQWQRAYSGGVYCYFNGFSETCAALGGLVYSLHQTTDGGYALAGDANLKLSDSTPLVPWLAKVDGSGGLVWQENDYQANTRTGRPLSEYFASSAITPVGVLAVGFTENPTSGLGELLGVQTDVNGHVGPCSQIHPSSTLSAIDPGLAELAPGLTTTTALGSNSPSPVQTQATTPTATGSQC
jgi:hypothetical protein